MQEEQTFPTEDARDTERLIEDIKVLIDRIRLLRIEIALYLLSSEVSPQRGETSGN